MLRLVRQLLFLKHLASTFDSSKDTFTFGADCTIALYRLNFLVRTAVCLLACNSCAIMVSSSVASSATRVFLAVVFNRFGAAAWGETRRALLPELVGVSGVTVVAVVVAAALVVVSRGGASRLAI